MPAPGAPLELREFERPRDGVLLQTLASEVCGTDVHLWKGQLAGVPYPIIPGHVSVGRVAETDGALDVDGHPLHEGQIVTFLDVYGTCGRCWFCTVARAGTRCPHRKVYGVTLSSDDGLLGGLERVHPPPARRPRDSAARDPRLARVHGRRLRDAHRAARRDAG